MTSEFDSRQALAISLSLLACLLYTILQLGDNVSVNISTPCWVLIVPNSSGLA